MSNIFFISDTHFNWKSIIKYDNRPFSSVEEMNEQLIKNWNGIVKSNDIVYHLGDFALGRVFDFKTRLRGNVHLILGNHDKLNCKEKKLFTTVSDIKYLKSTAPRIIMCHYPLRSWAPSLKGRIHLHGHCHGKLPAIDSIKCLDISDPVWNFTPIPLETIFQIFDGKIISPSKIGK